MSAKQLVWLAIALAWLAPLVSGISAVQEFPAAFAALGLDTTTLNTLLVAAAAACTSLLVSLGIAFAAFELPGLRSVLRIVLVPLLLAPRSLTIVPLQALVVGFDLQGSLFALTLCVAAGGIPLQALVLTEAICARGEQWRPLLRAAGAGPIQQAVILGPLVEPVCLALFLVELLRGVNSFLLPLLFTVGVPELQTLPVRAWQAAGGAGPDMQVAIGLVASAPGFLLLAATLVMRRRVASGVEDQPTRTDLA